MQDEYYMARALKLAQRGRFTTHPNPNVGCVIVKDGEIVGEGYHQRAGEPHAEVHALRMAGEKAKGATAYVTLEPCSHHGRTPPCCDALIAAGVARVVASMQDPNPQVAGRGLYRLQQAGIDVSHGLMMSEAEQLNKGFLKRMRTGFPYIQLKLGASLDGRTAMASGESQWITSPQARRDVQLLRAQSHAILTSSATVLADDPMLNCRVEGGVDPVRIICDSNLRIPTESQIVKTASDIETIVACSQEALESERKQEKIRRLKEAGIQIIGTEGAHGVNLVELMKKLGGQNIDSILLEGGGTLNASALEDGIVNKVYAYIAGKLIGGMDARSPVEGMGIDRMADAITLQNVEIEKLGDDFCIVGYVK